MHIQTSSALRADFLKASFPSSTVRGDVLAFRSEARNPASEPRHFLAIGPSPSMARVVQLLKRVSGLTYPVLITGESGTGKELIARAIHANSRPHRPFVSVDCAALVPTLIESELFGHLKGAFTDARRSKTGLLCQAEGGTVLLDEVGELPLDLQSKLLRVLQEKEVRPVGATHTVPISARVLAATSRDLEAMVARNEFRLDLYSRLNVVNIMVPPLRERREDLPLLIRHFLRIVADELDEQHEFSGDLLSLLNAYDWPGNIRQLKHVIERICASTNTELLTTADIPQELRQLMARPTLTELKNEAEQDWIIPMAEVEKRAIQEAISRLGGDKLLAAKLLGIGKTTLYRKLKEYGGSGTQHGPAGAI
jgi:transcriptional regulator with PAS, ATPase and Fis domain